MGIIFNIQKFSIHDGPGIRTTIFLKGCPLHCPWCSNPESQNPDIQLTWNHQTCIGCKRCIESNLSAIKFVKDHNFTNRLGERLTLCNVDEECAKKYVSICPSGALSYEGYEMHADEVIQEALKDIAFYEESQGGITLSGGEVLYQSQFAIDILQKAKEHHIHTACETTCLCTHDIFKKFITNLDLLLCDIKHYDEDKHKTIIGCSLTLIDENIRYAVKQPHLKVIGRIPVIPNFNYSIADAHELSKRLLAFGITEVHLLPYHNFGGNKYSLLCRPYTYEPMANLNKNDEKFQAYKQIFQSYGLHVA